VSLFRLGIEDAYNLFSRFSRTEYNLWQSLADVPVMVNLGKAQVLKWQIAQLLYSLLDADFAVFNFLK
jgi:hypothetical protein